MIHTKKLAQFRSTWLRHRWTWRAVRRIWWRRQTRCSSYLAPSSLDVTSSEKDLVKMTDSLLVLPGSVIAGRDELWEGFGEDDGFVARPTWLRHRWMWRALRRIWWRWRIRCSSYLAPSSLDVTSSKKNLVKMTDSLLVLPGSVIAGRDELWEGFGEDDGFVARPNWLRHRWMWRALRFGEDDGFVARPTWLCHRWMWWALRRIWWRWRTHCSSYLAPSSLDVTSSEKDLVKMTDSLLVSLRLNPSSVSTHSSHTRPYAKGVRRGGNWKRSILLFLLSSYSAPISSPFSYHGTFLPFDFLFFVRQVQSAYASW